MQIRARHYQTGAWIDLTLSGDRIAVVTAATGEAGAHVRQAGWVAPGLFDLQINGCEGRAFVSPTLTVAEVAAVVRTCWRHGIVGLCPTLITGPFDALCHGFATLRQACEQDAALDRAMPCFHLEGPYISAEDGPRGAHLRVHVRPPDLDEFHRWQEAAGGRIRLVTLAPEQDTALAFIERLTQEGVVVALGHTAAPPARIREAIRAGARLSTHLGNGCHALLPRHDSYLWEQLAADELTASVIADGHHLPPAVLRVLMRVKTPARLVLTCDASSLAGLPPGRYTTWGQQLEVQPGGKVVVPGTSFLGGSGVFTDACVDHLLRLGDVRLDEALDMAGANPRRLLGLPAVRLEAGAAADLVLFDHGPDQPFRPQTTIVAGECV